MYWSRTGSILEIAAWLVLSGLWGLGGWLLVAHVFRLKSRERLMVGLASGMILFIVLSNLLAQVVALPLAFWGAALLILAAGAGAAIYAAWKQQRIRIRIQDLLSWRQLVALFALIFIFEMIGRGLALFDEYLHLPLISIMAAGDFPPPFYLDPSKPMSYHYGLQILAASMVRLGGFFPWSAWDLSKAIAIAMTLVLGWQWIRRVTNSERAATLGTFLVTFGGGARWLLLLVPASWLLWMSNGVTLTNTGADTAPNLFLALSRPWPVEGGGSSPFPFAFHNGIFVPVMFILGSTGAMSFMTAILLLMLTARRNFSVPASILIGLIFASLALSAEHLFVFFWAGVLLAGAIYWIRLRLSREKVPRDLLLGWGIVLLISAGLSVVQGGYLTEAARSIFLRLQGVSVAQGPYDYFYFTLRWPPGLTSAHLGDLSFLNPRQIFVLLAELGPALLMVPFASAYAWWGIRRRDWMLAGLGAAGLLSFVVAVFFQYGFERSATRLPATALWIWVLLGFPVLWKSFSRGGSGRRFWLRAGYGITVLGGIVIFAIQLSAIPAPQLSYYINITDAQMSRQLWDRLPANALVFDRDPSRSVALFGQPTLAYEDVYKPLPEWSRLVDDPSPNAMAQAGYAFVYLDRAWWDQMTADQHAAFQQSCVKTFAQQVPDDGDFRRLLDIRSCK